MTLEQFIFRQVEWDTKVFKAARYTFINKASLDRWVFNYQFYLSLQGKTIFNSH